MADAPVIKSTAKATRGNGWAFRSWSFMTFMVAFARNLPPHRVILDTGTGMSTADAGWLREVAPYAVIYKLTTLIWLNGIAGSHTSDAYVDVDLWLPCRTQNGSLA